MQKEQNEKYWLAQFKRGKIICAIDEVGMGSLAGPACAAAVIVDLEKAYKFSCRLKLKRRTKRLTICDSKELNLKERYVVRDALFKANIIIHCYIVAADSRKVNLIHNIFKVGEHVRERALTNLWMNASIKPDACLVDHFNIEVLPPIETQIFGIDKGDDRFVSIGAASIVAKCYHDTVMMDLAKKYPHYGWNANMGYRSQTHLEGMKKYGITKQHRLFYHDVVDAINYRKQKGLEVYCDEDRTKKSISNSSYA